MEKKMVVKPEEMQVVDGKVVISSEELAAAIQNYNLDMEGGQEEANGITIIHQNGCHVM